METQAQKEIVLRHYADNTYGIGEVVSPNGAVLFRAGNFDLTQEEFAVKLAHLNKAGTV